MRESRIKVAHILPGMYFGGVEVAIFKSHKDLNKSFDYNVYYVRERGPLEIGQSWVFELISGSIRRAKRPDLIITSLWWGHLFGILSALLGSKWACFIHSTGHSSFLDKVVTKIALTLCNYHFFDSETSKAFFDSYKSRASFVVPYILEGTKNPMRFNLMPQYTFSWVGRNSPEKRLDLVIKFLRALDERSVDYSCHLCVAGTAHAELEEFISCSNARTFVRYNVPPDEISEVQRNSKVALCFSDYEGFSVTTAEAALQGNVICARRVGELANYLHEESVIWLEDLTEAAWENLIAKTIEYIEDEALLRNKRTMSRQHIRQVFQSQDYKSAFERGVRSVCGF